MASTAPRALRTHTPARPWRFTKYALAAVSASALALATLSPDAHAAPGQENPTGVPKNVIFMIGDGMGFNTLDLYNLHYRNSTGYQVSQGGVQAHNKPQPGFQRWPHVAMSTYAAIGTYNSQVSWSSVVGANGIPTDSAAAGTAMATGHKTFQGVVGMDVLQRPLENLTERAKKLGKSAGVVSSVPYSHATPACYVAHEPQRSSYHNITRQMLDSQLDVVIAPGHPLYDNNHQRQSKPDYTYISESDWTALSTGKTPYSFIEKKNDFTKLARTNKNYKGKRFWGIPQVATTLQQGRDSRAAKTTDEFVGQSPRNNAPTLSDLSLGALNVLDDNPRGTFLMIEGGAIDWSGHANETARIIEETSEFANAVNDVAAWVEKYSSWNETLLIVTADHETGFVNDPSRVNFRPLGKDASGAIQMEWLSGQHTNQLVPFFVRGAGSRTVLDLANQQDLKRGKYLDNTQFAQLVMQRWWVKR